MIKSRLKLLMESEAWEDLEKACDEVVAKWNDENVIGTTSDETLRLTYLREGKKIALKEFLKYLYDRVS